MVKTYLRYESAASFGVIVSPESNITYDSSGKHLLAAALEKLGVWHVRQGVCTKTLAPSSSSSSRGPSLAVTSIASSPTSLIASGYADGSIRIWDYEKGTCETTLNGHKGAVSVLKYNNLGSLLASGSKDDDIILWDVISETGLFRLRGHRDQVTDLVFLDSVKKLVSASKDKFLRVWDLETQHCMQTISGHHSEIWSIDVDPTEKYLVTGSSDPELRFYSIKQDSETHENGTESKFEVLKLFGETQRQSKDRVSNLRFNKTGNLLACQVAGKTVEIFRVLNEAEAKHKAKRRIKRKKEKGKTGTEDSKNPIITVSDVFQVLQVLRAGKKISSMSFSPNTTKNSLATIALSLNNNLLEFYSIGENSEKSVKSSAIELPGHRAVIRSVTLSSDNSLLLSTSHSAVKIWNPSTGSCLRTIDSDYGICSIFVPGNKYAIIGTNGGKIEIIDVRSGTCVEVVEAHGGAIQSIVASPGGEGFVTGSVDHDVKFWEYETSKDSKHLTVTPVKNMKMNEDVVAIAVSPDGKYIAIALLDCTVKVFFMDSHKFFLSLYGHKLPVLCLDISSDGTLLVSGSGDKNLKIWGLDFGDCRKSLFAHADSVTAVKFVNNTHYMFSVGKDRVVKYWNADTWELILTLEGHHNAISCLTVSERGDFLLTGSFDRSIRRWDRTEEQLFIEEEQEKRLEEMFEPEIENKYERKEEIPEEGAVGLAGKITQETLSATDSIIEALDIADVELKRVAEHKEEVLKGKSVEFRSNILMLGLSPSDYVLRALSKVQTNDLEQTLLAVPFSDALKIFSYLKDWAAIPDKVELVCRINRVLIQLHHNQLVATVSARPLLTAVKDILTVRLKECKDMFGFNLAAMDHLKQLLEVKSDGHLMDSEIKRKLMEIRSKRIDETRPDLMKVEKSKKKKQKKIDGSHVWS